MTSMRLRTHLRGGARLLATAVVGLALAVTASCGDDEQEPLKIALLLNYEQAESDGSMVLQRSFELAIRHVNAGGGVLGQPVEFVIGNSTSDPAVGVEEARRLIEEEGVHAIVGPGSSAQALPIAEQVAGPLEVPLISPAATSPLLTTAEDGGYFFRTALSDVAQGPVLARVSLERGFDNVGLIYRDDPWGRGLHETIAAAWGGALTAAPFDPDAATHLPALRETAAGGAQALIVIAFTSEAVTIVGEALEAGLYDQFVFGDGARSLTLVEEIGGDRLGDMYGTASGGHPGSDSLAAWERAYSEAYGELSVDAYLRETYDAAIAIALAAEAAGSVEGAAIRDHLRAIGGAPGELVIAGPEGIARALEILGGGDEVDYDGAAVSLDWDEHGDLLRGYIGIWRFTRDERIEDLEAVPYGE